MNKYQHLVKFIKVFANLEDLLTVKSESPSCVSGTAQTRLPDRSIFEPNFFFVPSLALGRMTGSWWQDAAVAWSPKS